MSRRRRCRVCWLELPPHDAPGRKPVVHPECATKAPRCRICLRAITPPKRTGPTSSAHDACREVVEREILAHRPKRRPRAPNVTTARTGALTGIGEEWS
jgi:hypothetical protein